MELLGEDEGPRIGAALGALREEVDAGEVRDGEQARAFIQAWGQRAPEDQADA
jgi:hypothetical protein